MAPGHLDPAQANARIRPAAEQALQLDPLLAEAHAAMGEVYSRDMDWARAEKAFRRATELNPNLTIAYTQLAYWVLDPAGRFEEALQELDKATRADPLSGAVWVQRGLVMCDAGRYDEAIESCRRALALGAQRGLAEVTLGRALLAKGRSAEAIAILEGVAQHQPAGGGQLGYAYGITGRRAECEAMAARNVNAPRRLAWIYAGLGDKDRVFGALDAMLEQKDPVLPNYLGMPELLPLTRGDPRLAALRRRVGLK
jgi:tetratricopeptide (TPR) repeat protein